jgi:hypothetical protein
MADIGTAKAGTIVAAAMETAGAALQSRMLEFVLGPDGMQLAGLLYLIGICAAIIIVAVGGSYRWGRYLLIGPSLFLVLTQIQTESDGTEWAFGTAEYSQAAVEKALVGVDVANGGVGNVSLFYHFWNVFMSETTHRLIALLNLTATDSQFNFVQKVERFMNSRNFASINDSDLRLFVSFTLSNQCSRYFALERAVNDLSILQEYRELYQPELVEWSRKVVYFSPDIQEGPFREMDEWVQKQGISGPYTCPQLWAAIIDILRPQIRDMLNKELEESNMPEQDQELTKDNFVKQWASSISRRSGILGSGYASEEAGFADAVDWLVAKAMWNEVWARNPYIQAMELETNSGLFQSGMAYMKGSPSGINQAVSQNIRQFEETNSFAERSRFTTAALSMPYFQGVGLCLLSALYPFFAIMVVVPGRAASIFVWMGLWAWLKLWDLGFAVVMLIDNMLYAMFPRGLSVDAEAMTSPGLAWQRVLEIDPNYSLSTYYTMISTCLFAVPLVTAVFVKMGGGELVNMMNQGLSDYSSRIGGAAASFARSLQTQGYMQNLQEETQRRVLEKLHQTREQVVKPLQEQAAFWGMMEGALQKMNPGNDSGILNAAASFASSKQEAIGLKIDSAIDEAAYTEKFAVETSDIGFHASESAVGARYYQHDLKGEHPGIYEFKSTLAEGYLNVKKPASAALNSAVRGVFGGGGR